MPTGKSVCFLKEMEGREEKEEAIRRKDQTKKDEGLRQRRKQSLSTPLPSPSTTHTPTPEALIC